jgi:peptidoglycan/xylan/chitin deacetylase (PgdA/CDA1 family)
VIDEQLSPIGAYSPIVERPPLTWPNGARMALWIVPNIEYYRYQPPQPTAQASRMPHPDVSMYGWRDYGNRVGIWRMLDVLDKHQLKITLSLNLGVYENCPDVLEALEARKYDVMSHGMFNSDAMFALDEDGERAYIDECMSVFRKLTGREISGWFSPANSLTRRTPDLLAEAGIQYLVDYFHDDQPFPIPVRRGRLLTLPYSMDVNDGWNYRHNLDAEEICFAARDQFDRLYAESAKIPRVMHLALHPYTMGQPHRVKLFDELIGYMLSHEGIWQATGMEITQWYNDNHLPQIEKHMASAPCWGKKVGQTA